MPASIVPPAPAASRGGQARPTATAAPELDNAGLAQALREMAVLLEAQGDNPFRVGAYRRAADTVARHPRPLRELRDSGGLAGLDALPGIGPRIAAAIDELLATGRWAALERLRGAADPETLLRTVPGVGAALAHRLHDELGVDTLEGLEVQAHAGRLAGLSGVGPRRAAAIRAALAELLNRRRRQRGGTATALPGPEPPVQFLLEVDRAYREQAAAGRLALIAPRRFNPEGRPWLPVLHMQRPGWHFTALYSNTARAHELGRVFDWVVLYAEDDQHHERPYTVVTAARGTLLGRRVVRGREDECRVWYAASEPGAPAEAAPARPACA